MNSIPQWLKSILHLLYISLANPFVIAVIFFLLWGPLSQETSTNVGKIPGWAIPIWILFGLLIAGILTGVQYFLAKLIAKTTYPEFRRFDFIAQLPYLFFVFFSLLFMTGEIEGNIMGFIYFPVFIILALVTAPISIILSVVLLIRTRRKNLEESNQA